MPQAIELYFDLAADGAVRAAWADLDQAGVPSLGSRETARYQPHVSLAVWNGSASPAARSRLAEASRGAVGLRLELVSLGFFGGSEAPAFLGVTPTAALLAIHRQVADTAIAVVDDYWPHYRPDAWTPHCTVAMRVVDRATVARTAASWTLPITAEVAAIHLIDVPTGVTIADLSTVP